MRKLSDVIDQINAAIPQPFPPEWATNLTALTVELGVLRKRSVYQPREASHVLWDALGILLNRYVPPPGTAPRGPQRAQPPASGASVLRRGAARPGALRIGRRSAALRGGCNPGMGAAATALRARL